MDAELTAKVRKCENRHKVYLVTLIGSKIMESWGKRGLWPFIGDEIRWLVSLLGHLPLLFLFYAILQNMIAAAAVYLGIHLIAFAAGLWLHKSFEKKLTDLGTESVQLHSAYFLERCGKHGIEGSIYGSIYGGEVPFEDGVVIGSGRLCAPMRKDYGAIRICRLDVCDDWDEYYTVKYDHNNPRQTMEQNIASLDFNNKFGVLTDKTNELNCMKYLSPALQLKMIKAKGIERFKKIEVNGNWFCAVTNITVETPSDIQIFRWKPLQWHFREVDRYCSEMRSMADTVYADFRKIDVLLGSDI